MEMIDIWNIYRYIYYLIGGIFLFYRVLDNFDYLLESIDRSIDETIDRSLEQR